MVQTRAPVTLAVTSIFLALCTVFVSARFVSKAWLVKKVKLDDWFILVAWLLALGFSISVIYGCSVGLGRHNADIPEGWHVSLRASEYAFSVLYTPALMATKTSIIVFFLSLSTDDKVFKWLNILTLVAVNACGCALTFVNIFQCRPVSSTFLYPSPPNVNCTDIVTLYLSSAPVNIITDLAILLIPMPILTGMRLPKKQKIILIVTFSFGGFVAIVDVIRIAYLQSAQQARIQAINDGVDTRVVEQDEFPWNASLSFMWSAVEVNLGIICACVPSLKPLFTRFLPSFIKSADDTSRGGSIDRGSPPVINNNQKGSKTGSSSPQLGDFATEEIEKPKDPRRALTNPAAFKKASNAEYTGDDSGDEMGFLNFLSGPPEEAPPGPADKKKSSAMKRVKTNASSASNFGFVDMGGPKSMVSLSNKQSFRPVAWVTILFFMWGFAYGLLAVLNAQFQNVVHMSNGMRLGLHAAYFGGYVIGPLSLGRWVLKRFGFKSCLIVGLCVYSMGTLIFWPSAVLASSVAFTFSNLIVGIGVSIIETAANPYVALCGPMEYAEVRLNLSQGVQAIGSILSPLLAQRVLFKNVDSASSLIDVQWTYLAIALFDVALAVVFFYISIPESTDEEFEQFCEKRSAVYNQRIGPYRIIWYTLALGVFSQFCYVGAQEAYAGTSGAFLSMLRTATKGGDSLTLSDYDALSHTVFAFGRFAMAFMNYLVKPRFLLTFLFIGSIITSALCMRLEGDAGKAMALLVYFFEAGIFPIIFAMTLRGMGRHTKTASVLLAASISGGAVFPPIQAAVADGHGVAYSFCIAVAVFAFGLLYPIYLNLVPAAKKQVDPIHEVPRRQRLKRLNTGGSVASDAEAPEKQFGLAGILARRKKQKARESELPTHEHVEKTSPNPSGSSSPNSQGTPTSSHQLPKGVEDAYHPSRQGRRPSKVSFMGEKEIGVDDVSDLGPWPDEKDEIGAKYGIERESGSSNGHEHNDYGPDLTPFAGSSKI